MRSLPKARIPFDTCVAWAKSQVGRYELVEGKVVAMSSARSGLDCNVFPDWVTVLIAERFVPI